MYSTSGEIMRGLEMVLNWKKKRNAKNHKVTELPRLWTKNRRTNKSWLQMLSFTITAVCKNKRT